MDGTDRGTLHVRVAGSEALPDFDGAPVRIFLFEVHDELLDLHRQLVGMAIRPSAAVGEAINAAIFIAAIDLVAGLAGNAELTAQASHFRS